jgi:hypothetical protein
MAAPPSDKSGDFDSLGLAAPLVASVTALGYEEPTPIQREAIPLLLRGRDLLGQAATGTGKTAAFALPMLQRISEDTENPDKTRGLVLVPTRELAMQVAEAIHKYAKGTGLHVVPLYGGAPMDLQIRALKRGADIVVATPGRALDHIRRRTLKLDKVRIVTLDEADEMLDMGFAEDLEAILESTPAERQTASSRRRAHPESPPSQGAICASRRASRSRGKSRLWERFRGYGRSRSSSAALKSRRSSGACSIWKAHRRPSSFAARVSRSTSWSRL